LKPVFKAFNQLKVSSNNLLI
jgi:hypothetical protein